MLNRLIPRDEQFFDLFDQLAAHLATAAGLLDRLFAEPHKRQSSCGRSRTSSTRPTCSRTTINQRIDKSFITPIDREDIHLLASRLDDVIDLIDGTARRVRDVPHQRGPRAARSAGARARRGRRTQIRTPCSAIRKPPTGERNASAEIKQLEEEGDAIYHEAVGALFAGKPDPLEVIKWKEIYDTLERAIDSAWVSRNVLQSISLKNA